MEIDREDLRRHYASLSDDELLAIDPADLTEVARKVYEREMEQRQLTAGEEVEEKAAPEQAAPAEEEEGEPDWLETAACACSFHTGTQSGYVRAEFAAEALRRAGVPCRIVPDQVESGADLLNVMVPGALNLKAASVLDRDLFNEELEESWRVHFAELSDRELRALPPGVICAGLLDRANRLRRVYEEEAARRDLDQE